MQDALVGAVLELTALVSPSKARAIANSFRHLASAATAPTPGSLVDTPTARVAVRNVLAAWEKAEVNGQEIAGMLIGASAAHLSAERELGVELVWTGPTTEFVPTRRTEQVLLDLIAGATSELFLVSFVAYNVRSIVEALKDGLSHGIRLRMLVEASIANGGTLTTDHAAVMRAHLPTVELFTWTNRTEEFIGGRVHAKVAVVDRARAFITSANLTEYALERNMEAGVLAKGGPLPSMLADHLDALIDVGVISRIP